MKKRIMALLLCFTMIMSSLMGCGASGMTFSEGEERKEITFSWWGGDSRNEYTIAAIREFEKQNPNIKVRLEYSEFTGFKEKTDVKMQAHTEADVIQLNFAWVSGYSPDGKGFYDLSKLSGTLNLENYTDEMLSYGKINGVYNALPIAQNGHVLIYNKSLYDKYGLDIPKTWDDLYAAAEVMNKDGVYPMDLGSVAMWFLCIAYVEQLTGNEIITSDGKFNFTKDEVKTMIEFYTSLVEKGVVENVSVRSDNKLKEGKYAGTSQWINSATKYGDMFTASGGTSVIGSTLTMSGAKRTGWYVRPATMYAISANTSYPDEAAKLLEFLVASEEMAMQQLLDKGIPFNKSAKTVLEQNNQLNGLMNDAANAVDATQTYLMDPMLEDAKLNAAFQDACAKVLYGQADLESAAQTAYDAMVKAFE